MVRIDIQMIGYPKTSLEGRNIQFRYQKSEAIFYFIVCSKSVDRYRIMNLFWPEETEERARKNLRNALYSIRQAFDCNIINNSGQRLVSIADAIEIYTDCDSLWNPEAPLADSVNGEFLDGFVIKDSMEFEEWVQQIRSQLRNTSISKLVFSLKEIVQKGENPEHICKELIRMDPYNEDAVRVLIQHFSVKGQFARCMEAYTHLARLLEDELSLKPEPETVRVFQQSVELRRMSSRTTGNIQPFFYGRHVELEGLEAQRQKLRQRGHAGLALINGEAGIGKTTLLQCYFQSLKEESTIQMGITCSEGDENYLLKAWFPLVIRMGELLMEQGQDMEEYHKEVLGRVFPTFMNKTPSGAIYQLEKRQPIPFPVIVKVVKSLLERVNESAPLLLFIEDAQWIDGWSLDLLRQLVYDPESPGVYFVLTSRLSDADWQERFAMEFGRHDNMLPVSLMRFTPSETEEFISLFPGRPEITAKMRRSIFSETEGNPLMITEILKSLAVHGIVDMMPPKVRNVLGTRYRSLNGEARKVADLLSIFSDAVGWDTIRELYGKPDMELLEAIEELIRNAFIRETEAEPSEIRYVFTHQKLRTYVYEQQSLTKRRMLHKRVGNLLKSRLTNTPSDRMLYPQIMYQFERAGEQGSHLEFRIKCLYDYLEISHELFPRIRDRSVMALKDQPEFHKDHVLSEIRDIEKAMNARPQTADDIRLRLDYLKMIGCYHIIQGHSDIGIALTEQMIALARESGENQYAMKGYLQLIYNDINQRRIEDMEVLINQAFYLFRQNVGKAEIGILIRLKGYLMILKDRFLQGETYLKSAAAIFERPEYCEQYALNRVATYFYMGESRRLQNDFSGAEEWYRKAQDLCRAQGFGSHSALMLSSLGIAAYDSKRYDYAYAFLREAVGEYDRSNFKWGQISAYGYWALLCIRRGSIKEGVKYLKLAERISEESGMTFERGLILRIKSEICCLKRQGLKLEGLAEWSEEPQIKLCQQAIRFFDAHESFSYERKILRDIMDICDGCRSLQA